MAAIFLSGGIGDFLALESHFPQELKNSLGTVYYASRAHKEIKALFDSVPNEYPCLLNHVPLWQNFIHYWAVKDKPEFETYIKDIPTNWADVIDWSIFTKFPLIQSGQLPFQGSTFTTHKVDWLSRTLPPNYIFIHPDTTDWRPRRILPAEWQTVIAECKQRDCIGVVIGTGDYQPPDDRQLINLFNQTTIAEAIEILKKAKGFIGIDSCFSVLAAQLFQPNQILVKSSEKHLDENKAAYYAPLKDFGFIRSTL